MALSRRWLSTTVQEAQLLREQAPGHFMDSTAQQMLNVLRPALPVLASNISLSRRNSTSADAVVNLHSALMIISALSYRLTVQCEDAIGLTERAIRTCGFRAQVSFFEHLQHSGIALVSGRKHGSGVVGAAVFSWCFQVCCSWGELGPKQIRQ